MSYLTLSNTHVTRLIKRSYALHPVELYWFCASGCRWPFLVITLSYTVIYVIYCHQLPFYFICGVHLTKFSPIFASFQQQMPRKLFFRRSGGAPAPLHPLATPMPPGTVCRLHDEHQRCDRTLSYVHWRRTCSRPSNTFETLLSDASAEYKYTYLLTYLPVMLLNTDIAPNVKLTINSFHYWQDFIRTLASHLVNFLVISLTELSNSQTFHVHGHLLLHFICRTVQSSQPSASQEFQALLTI